ncbi:hypothetical protein SAICODRAFT_22165 [Saitoella complicata NRRL Y-17804]|uniref:uncharacterized protein n=1 Tax=Saitoella complicata (strain BCRC 22490 / CBS 7301 / JCM 7358 / NBRC 10748 / NRRL Y-17804) TaxID=698492 RepID=UPI0008682E32|nr:uncharacterized protein SAICODRAFT_22165 [Saitoella complicata NRRL Y-17804]ODQ49756.1 hypothetical protein SAICODRAFT_22165 [Saitoella complicata NRRL Y-17804]
MLNIRLARSTLISTSNRLAMGGLRFVGTGSQMSDNDPAKLQRAKERHLKGEDKDKPMDDAPGWNETLASTSEAHVKADKEEGTMEEFQKKTVQHVSKKHHE